MKELIDKVQITWSFLYMGLKENFLQKNEIITLINQNKDKLGISEDILIELNIIDDKIHLLEKIKEIVEIKPEEGVEKWQYLFLLKIKESNQTIEEKLREIELQWSRFDYPEAWSNFIYYMPNQNCTSSNQVYGNFENFLKSNRPRSA